MNSEYHLEGGLHHLEGGLYHLEGGLYHFEGRLHYLEGGLCHSRRPAMASLTSERQIDELHLKSLQYDIHRY